VIPGIGRFLRVIIIAGFVLTSKSFSLPFTLIEANLNFLQQMFDGVKNIT